MPSAIRVIDTGVRDGRRQIAFDQALIELHKAGTSPDTIRFLRFPPTVLVGRHQALEEAIRLEACVAAGVGIVRRITGGGAIYLDEGQVGWEIVLSRRRLRQPSLVHYSRVICMAVAQGLASAFAIDARYRPPTDIEVDGAKLCGTGGYFDGDTLVYQGTVLIDVNPGSFPDLLRLPPPAADSPPSRLTTLKQLLGGTPPDVGAVQAAVLDGLARGLDLALHPGAPSDAEEALAEQVHADEIGTEDFVRHGDRAA